MRQLSLQPHWSDDYSRRTSGAEPSLAVDKCHFDHLTFIVAFSVNVEQRLLTLPWMDRLYAALRQHLSAMFGKSGWQTHFGIGLLNGLLPCGLVYMAIAGAITSGEVGESIAYMALFGLGTIPLMLTLMLAGQLIGVRSRSRLRKLYPVMLTVMAILFIFRGLRIDLPADITLWADLPMCH